MKAIILAGGYEPGVPGLDTDLPKQLLKVKGKTIIEHLIDRIIELGIIDQVFIVTNEIFFEAFQRWEAVAKYRHVNIDIINDHTRRPEDRLGAVGDIMLTISEKGIDEDLLIVAGDHLINFSIRDLHNCYNDKDASVVALQDLKDPKLLAERFGCVMLNENNRVIDMEEKPIKPKSSLAATMCYILKNEDLKRLITYAQEDEQSKKVPGGEIIVKLANESEVYGFVFDDLWISINSIGSYKEACTQLNDYEQLEWIHSHEIR